MNKLLVAETNRITKSGNVYTLIIGLALLFILSYSLSLNEPNMTPISTIYNLFAINSQLLFPMMVTLFFAPIVTSDFKTNFCNILKISTHSPEKIYFTKFLSGTIILFIVSLTLFIAYTFFSLVFFDVDKLFVGIIRLSIFDYLGRISIIFIITFLYLSCFSVLAMIFATLTKNLAISLISIATISFIYLFLPFPDWLAQILFLDSFATFTAIAEMAFPYSYLLKILFINIVNLTILLMMGLFLYRKVIGGQRFE